MSNITPRFHRNLVRLHRCGWAALALWAAALVLWGILDPEPYANGWRLVLEMAVVGRAVNIADGMANGFGYPYLLLQALPQDIVMFAILYPWLVIAADRMPHWPYVGWIFRTLHASAARHQRGIQHLGVPGVWMFIFIPFWSTGALVGGVLGHLIGLRAIPLFLTVISSHAASIFALLLLFDAIELMARELNDSIVGYLPWAVVVFMLLMAIVGRFRRGVPPAADTDTQPPA